MIIYSCTTVKISGIIALDRNKKEGKYQLLDTIKHHTEHWTLVILNTVQDKENIQEKA